MPGPWTWVLMMRGCRQWHVEWLLVMLPFAFAADALGLSISGEQAAQEATCCSAAGCLFQSSQLLRGALQH
jgi:hypothetical protein